MPRPRSSSALSIRNAVAPSYIVTASSRASSSSLINSSRLSAVSIAYFLARVRESSVRFSGQNFGKAVHIMQPQRGFARLISIAHTVPLRADHHDVPDDLRFVT
jgi:hypothetical protein